MQGALLFRRMVSWCYTFDKLCSPLPIKTKKRPGGQREQGHGVVLHDKGEGYQQPKAFRSESSQVPQGVKEVSQFQISNWGENPIFLLELNPMPFLGLDLINPQSSLA